MSNFNELRKTPNYIDLVNKPDHKLFQIFVPGSAYDPIFSEVIELAGYTKLDINTPSIFVGRHAHKHCKDMAKSFVTLIYHVKRMIRNKDVPLEKKSKMIIQILSEFGNVTKSMFTADLVHLSSTEEVEKARVAFEAASYYVNKGEFGSTIFNGLMDLLNIMTNSLKKIQSGEFFNIDFLDMVDIAMFNTSEAIVELMGDDKYQHRIFHFQIWSDILMESPYLLWLKASKDGVQRVFDINSAVGVYRMSFDHQLIDSNLLRLKRSNVFSELNVAFGTIDIVVPTKKPKIINKRREYFKRKHKFMQKTSTRQVANRV